MAKRRTNSPKIKIPKKHRTTAIVVVLCFIVALILGAGTYYLMGKNDTFFVLGNKTTKIDVGETFTDDGAFVKVLGKDISSFVETKIYDISGEEITAIDTTVDSEYYIVYTLGDIDNLSFMTKFFAKKYSEYTQIRHVIVGEGVNE